jgi:hypothetical protein
MDTVHSASTEPELQGAMVTIRCKRKARSLCVTCITEAMHAPPVVRILNAKGNPKELTQAAGRPSPCVCCSRSVYVTMIVYQWD